MPFIHNNTTNGDNLPEWKPGPEPPSARHLNAMQDAIKRLAAGGGIGLDGLKVKFVELTGDDAGNGRKGGRVRNYVPGSNSWDKCESVPNVVDPASAVDRDGNKLSLGACVSHNGMWVRLGGSLTVYELKESLEPGGSAEAWPLTWDDGTNSYDEPDYDDEDSLVTVYDGQHRFRSIGYDDAPGTDRGAIVFCNADNVVVAGQQQARICLCQLTAAQTGSDSSFSVDTVTPMDTGQRLTAQSSDTLTAYNVCKGAGADNTVACIEFNESSGHWEIQWIANASQEVVTNYRIDGTNKKFQKKTRTAWANWVGSESDWTDVHTGGACP